MKRRYLLGAGALAGAGAWAGVSQSWGARFIRGRFEEFGREVPAAPHRPSPATWNDNGITLAWLGHASVLINFYGVRILTDPTFFRRIGVDLGVGSLGPLRLTQSALSPGDLPDIDVTLVSHAHFDHLDTPSLGAVRGTPVAVMAMGTSDLLPRSAYSAVHELAWGRSQTIRTRHGDLMVSAIEVKPDASSRLPCAPPMSVARSKPDSVSTTVPSVSAALVSVRFASWRS